MLPVVAAAIAAPTHSVVDAGLRSLPVVLPVLDFSTIKNDLFPTVAHVFSKTTSLAIKVRGLQAFVILCGGSSDTSDSSGLDGLSPERKPSSSSTALDKYTMQDKIVPLIKAIKTKEPAVMVEALNVLRVVGDYVDTEFIAVDILPILWNMSLGPLLNLKQFQTFMELIRSLSKKVEEEQTRKLQELSGTTNGSAAGLADDFMSFGGITGTQFDAATGATEDDFEKLVKGKSSSPNNGNPLDAAAGWDDAASRSSVGSPALKNPRANATFSWSTPSPTTAAPPPSSLAGLKAQKGSFRTVTPDLANLPAMTPSSTQYSQPLQPATTAQSAFPPPSTQPPASTSVNWSVASASASATAISNPWASTSTLQSTSQPQQMSSISPPPQGPIYGGGLNNSMASLSMTQQRPTIGSQNRSGSSFSLPPPPGSGSATPSSGFSLPMPPPPKQSSFSRPAGSMSGMMNGMGSINSMANTSMGGASSGIGLNNMMGSGGGMGMVMGVQQPAQQQPPQKSASGSLDKYQSLL